MTIGGTMVKFNWAQLDRNSIYDFMLLLQHKVVKVDLEVVRFHKIISNHLKKHLPIRTRRSSNLLVGENEVWVGGTYYSDYDQEKEKCIELVFEYHPGTEILNLSLLQYKRICRGIADTLLHEIIHMRQYRRRKFKCLPDYASNAEKQELRQEQSYLGCSDEIDAYGFNIACELYDKFDGKFNRIINYLNENQKGKQRRVNSWRIYLKAFQHNHNHPIIKRVKKKVVRYLPFAEIGKPYRNKDWIDH